MANQFTATLQRQLALGGVSFANTDRITGDQLSVTVLDVPAAQPATLSTRTDDNTGTLTMTNANHGIVTGDRIDIFWESAGAMLVQYGVTVGTVSGVSVPIDSGVGDNLPALNATVSVGKTRTTNVGFNSDDVAVYALYAAAAALIVITAGATVRLAQELTAGQTVFWKDGESANPLGDTQSITKVYMSHMDEDASQVMKAGFLLDTAAN